MLIESIEELEDIMEKEGIEVFQYVTDDLKDNRDLVLRMMKINGNLIEYISERLKNDKEVALFAIKNSFGHAYLELSQELKNDNKIINNVLMNLGISLEYSEKNIIEKGSDVYKNMLYKDKYILDFIRQEFKNNNEIDLRLVGDIFVVEEYFNILGDYLINNLDQQNDIWTGKMDQLIEYMGVIDFNLKNLYILSGGKIELIYDTYLKIEKEIINLTENEKVNIMSYFTMVSYIKPFIEYYKSNIIELPGKEY